MSKSEDFSARIGREFIPMAESVRVREIGHLVERLPPGKLPELQIRRCPVLPAGCYCLTVQPAKLVPYLPLQRYARRDYKGTLRVEYDDAGDIVFSGDLYQIKSLLKPVLTRVSDDALSPFLQAERAPWVDWPVKPIKDHCPVYSRRSYHSYLKGTDFSKDTWSLGGEPCRFTMEMTQFFYEHPPSTDQYPYSGEFDASDSRGITFELHTTDAADSYHGKMYAGARLVGNVTLEWKSEHFRKLIVDMAHTDGASPPPATVEEDGVTEGFESCFADVRWDVKLILRSDPMALPASLAGKDVDTCWSRQESHELLQAAPGHAPADLDKKWKLHLVCVPGMMGCSRGRMFDHDQNAGDAGDLNDVGREGAILYSSDGYPAADSSNFGDAEGDTSTDHPRAYLRTALHELTHALMQFHEDDFFVMTPTPSLADNLAAAGAEFPYDIALQFNETTAGRLKHLPDPTVRPGAMNWTSAAFYPQASDFEMADPGELAVEVKADKSEVQLGEVLTVNWTLKNETGHSVAVPRDISQEGQCARISVCGPDGRSVFMAPRIRQVCTSGATDLLAAGKSKQGSAELFWSRGSFAFSAPGVHEVYVVLVWQRAGAWYAAQGSTQMWVDYPATRAENEVAQLMLEPAVGRYVASGGREISVEAKRRVTAMLKMHAKHPAAAALARLGKRRK